MAQFGSAFDWGSKGRWFKSSHSDHAKMFAENILCGHLFCYHIFMRKHTLKNRTKRKKILISAAVVTAALVLLAAVFFIIRSHRLAEDFSAEDLKENELAYIVFDVGQGSSSLISSGDMQIVIDGGPFLNASDLADKIRPYASDGKIEYVIATHCHEDHVGGLQYIYDDFDVEHTIYGDLTEEQGYFWYFMNAVRKDGGSFDEDSDMTIELPCEAVLEIYDIEDGNEDPNSNSVVTCLKYRGISFLNTGDLGADMEEKLIPYRLRPTVVTAGHHGSSSSNSLLERFRPDYFIISCGKNNDGHHPHRRVLSDALKYTKDKNVYGTWRSGDIIFVTDGISLKTNLKIYEKLTLQDAGAVK